MRTPFCHFCQKMKMCLWMIGMERGTILFWNNSTKDQVWVSERSPSWTVQFQEHHRHASCLRSVVREAWFSKCFRHAYASGMKDECWTQLSAMFKRDINHLVCMNRRLMLNKDMSWHKKTEDNLIPTPNNPAVWNSDNKRCCNASDFDWIWNVIAIAGKQIETFSKIVVEMHA